ncbi:MAG: sel1 repeat family protein [Magnetococcales bacterium]|nr:sel1 repeat family protein [Magnetococcales bacterium]
MDNKPKTFEELEQWAQTGDPDGMAQLGVEYLAAKDGPDFENAWSWLRKAARQGQVMALFALGLSCSDAAARWNDSEKSAEALAWMERAAATGNLLAMQHLAQWLHQGKNTPVDEQRALAIEEQAIRTKGIRAMYLFGLDHCQTGRLAPDPQRCLSLLEEAARDGHVQAALELGLLHKDGFGSFAAKPLAAQKSRYWLNQAVSGGANRAALALGLAFLRGEPGYSRDQLKGIRWLTRAARLGSVNAMEVLGLIHLGHLLDQPLSPDPEQSKQWFDTAVIAGSAQAASFQGMHYLSGTEGYPKDFQKGKSLLEQAAQGGDTEAIRLLADSWSFGTDGFAADATQAEFWLRKGAVLGDPGSQLQLGHWLGFLQGRGILLPGPTEAELWLRKAYAASPDADPTFWCLYRFANQPGDFLERPAYHCLARQARDGSGAAIGWLGILHDEQGTIRPAHKQTARYWLEKSAAAGNMIAMVHLAFMLDRGEGGPVDHPAATAWLEQAEKLEEEAAWCFLGFRYGLGLGVIQDSVKAKDLLTRGAKAPLGDCQLHTGILHARGADGFNASRAEALRWFQQAADRGNPGALLILGLSAFTGSRTTPLDPQNFLQTRQHLQRAADLMDSDAMLLLGLLDAGVAGATPDPDATRFWFRKAARFGVGLAEQFRRQLADAPAAFDAPAALQTLTESIARKFELPADFFSETDGATRTMRSGLPA